MKKILLSIILGALVLFAYACTGDYMTFPSGDSYYSYETADTFNGIHEMPFVDVTEENKNISFELTSNSSAFNQIKKYATDGLNIPKDMVKVEEVLNHFDYSYANPSDGAVSLQSGIVDTPWNSESKLMFLGLKTKTIDAKVLRKNIVFLIDCSGSMSGSTRIGYLKAAFKSLVSELSENDIVSIVTYASSAGVVCDGVTGDKKTTLNQKIDNIRVGGSTYGSAGIEKAYELAGKYHNDYDYSTIILVTDGDFNVGTTSADGLKDMLMERRSKGIYFSALGVGGGNIQDDNFQSLVKYGQGNYGYLSDSDVAQSILIEDNMSFFTVVALEAKTQLILNPGVVSKFRIIGYENKTMHEEEYEEDTTPAGALSSNDSITAVIEFMYQERQLDVVQSIASWEVKYYESDNNNIITKTHDVFHINTISDDDLLFMSLTVEFCLILFESEYIGDSTYDAVKERLDNCTHIGKNDILYLISLLDKKV